ncbi:MAG: esterase [Winogradskyella sp.]|uniref:alpha/beta hydrolase-fold protein n=1 Tax=Winogradskyella sp. TaxID=1883156 RepID=UPI00184C802E|nr:esterase [Winogradskyella sp.]
MKKAIFIVFAILSCTPVLSQITYHEIESSKLNAARQLKIKLPKNYDPSSEIKHPVIIVFDGDYLFEPVVGQVDFQTYFDDMPGSIVVGVVQGSERYYDGYCDEVTGLPKESGLRFHDFVAEELIPYLDKTYNTSKFRVAVGHDLMGNFINSYLFKENPLFQAYVCISPDLSGTVKDYLGKRLEFFNDDIFYYLATSDKDIPQVRDAVLLANTQITEVNNQYLTYYFDDFINEGHYSLVTSAISRSFDKIFELYKPLREKELEEKVLTYEGTLDTYLVDRYERIEKLFGILKPITEAEIEKVVQVAEQREDLESLEKIGKLAKKLSPETLLGTYYLAQFAEKSGKIKKARKLYESALELKDVNHISKDDIFSKIDELAVVNTDEEGEEEDDEDN